MSLSASQLHALRVVREYEQTAGRAMPVAQYLDQVLPQADVSQRTKGETVAYLDRLVELGVLDRTEDRYRVTGRGVRLLANTPEDPLTSEQQAALEVLARAPRDLTATDVARCMWPNSEGWSHSKGRTMGAVAGKLLHRLRARGYADQKRTRSKDRWTLTPAGREALRVAREGKQEA